MGKKKSKGTKAKAFGKINTVWKGDKVKAKRQAVKKVEIRVEHNGWANEYSFSRPGAETWSTGYARPFTAKRGAERHFKDFISKGGRLEFIKNY